MAPPHSLEMPQAAYMSIGPAWCPRTSNPNYDSDAFIPEAGDQAKCIIVDKDPLKLPDCMLASERAITAVRAQQMKGQPTNARIAIGTYDGTTFTVAAFSDDMTPASGGAHWHVVKKNGVVGLPIPAGAGPWYLAYWYEHDDETDSRVRCAATGDGGGAGALYLYGATALVPAAAAQTYADMTATTSTAMIEAFISAVGYKHVVASAPVDGTKVWVPRLDNQPYWLVIDDIQVTANDTFYLKLLTSPNRDQSGQDEPALVVGHTIAIDMTAAGDAEVIHWTSGSAGTDETYSISGYAANDRLTLLVWFDELSAKCRVFVINKTTGQGGSAGAFDITVEAVLSAIKTTADTELYPGPDTDNAQAAGAPITHIVLDTESAATVGSVTWARFPWFCGVSSFVSEETSGYNKLVNISEALADGTHFTRQPLVLTLGRSGGMLSADVAGGATAYATKCGLRSTSTAYKHGAKEMPYIIHYLDGPVNDNALWFGLGTQREIWAVADQWCIDVMAITQAVTSRGGFVISSDLWPTRFGATALTSGNNQQTAGQYTLPAHACMVAAAHIYNRVLAGMTGIPGFLLVSSVPKMFSNVGTDNEHYAGDIITDSDPRWNAGVGGTYQLAGVYCEPLAVHPTELGSSITADGAADAWEGRDPAPARWVKSLAVQITGTYTLTTSTDDPVQQPLKHVVNI